MDYEHKIFKTIVFVRHGQYSSDPEELTRLGKKQSEHVGKSLRPLMPSKLYCSTMPRAIETATIIAKHIKLKYIAKDFFCEGLLPGTAELYDSLTEKSSLKEKAEIKERMKVAKESADLACDFIFRAPKRGQTCEVVVAHGNVIRYWVCKALKIDERKWTSMNLNHTSLTTIRVDKNGDFMLLGFADIGHMPHLMRTYV